MVLLIVVSLALSSRAQDIACNICSVWVALLMLGTMIYQIEYIEKENWDYTCVVSIEIIHAPITTSECSVND